MWERVADPRFLGEVERKAEWLHRRLREISLPGAHEVRGLGLHVGVRTELPSQDVAAAAFEENLVVTAVGDRVIQLRPSLTVTHEDLEHALGLLECAVTAALWAPC